eukprot:764137-Hanusia_phi.AAC.3
MMRGGGGGGGDDDKTQAQIQHLKNLLRDEEEKNTSLQEQLVSSIAREQNLKKHCQEKADNVILIQPPPAEHESKLESKLSDLETSLRKVKARLRVKKEPRQEDNRKQTSSGQAQEMYEKEIHLLRQIAGQKVQFVCYENQEVHSKDNNAYNRLQRLRERDQIYSNLSTPSSVVRSATLHTTTAFISPNLLQPHGRGAQTPLQNYADRMSRPKGHDNQLRTSRGRRTSLIEHQTGLLDSVSSRQIKVVRWLGAEIF